MNKMREAFERWLATQTSHKTPRAAAFEAGYQAAIAAVKEGGPVGYLMENDEAKWFGLIPDNQGATSISLYKLPEDEV